MKKIRADIERNRLLEQERELLRFIAERKKIEECHCGHIVFDLDSAKDALHEAKGGWQVNQNRLSRLEGLVSGLERELRSERYASWKDEFMAIRALWMVREALERFL